MNRSAPPLGLISLYMYVCMYVRCMCDVCVRVCACCVWGIIEAGYYTIQYLPSTCRNLNSLKDDAI